MLVEPEVSSQTLKFTNRHDPELVSIAVDIF
jgi:hypothetical protein